MSIVMQLNPYDFFTDTAGDALDGGYIYIGQPNLDPRLYPVTVYYDEALTVPAAQPLRTASGYIARNGSPSFLFINGNYSILVQDSRHRQIYYVPDFLLIGNAVAVNTGDLANQNDPAKGAALVGFKYPIANAVGRTVYSKLQEYLSVEDFGIFGDYVTDQTAKLVLADAAAYAAGLELYFPAGVYRMTDGIDRQANWRGSFAPQLANFPITGDDKAFLRPGFKASMPGTTILFTGTGTKSMTTQRSDAFSSFTYCVRDTRAGMKMRDLAIVLDVDVYDAGGSLTAYGADNSANYQVGRVIDDVAQGENYNVIVYGYFSLAGTAIRTLLGNDDPDYNLFIGGNTMGRYGLALIGSQSDDGFDSGLSGTQTFGMDMFTLDHHSRSLATAPTIYANADTWACIYIDGFTDAAQADINGHYFHGGSIRTYAIHPIALDFASQTNFAMNIFETSNFASAPFAATKQWTATANTQDVGISMSRFATDNGIFGSAFAGIMKGQLAVFNCPGLASGGGMIIAEKSPTEAVSQWIKVGGASGGSGDPAIQFGTGSALSSTTGWSLRRDISDADTMDLRWNGTKVFSVLPTGGVGLFGLAVGPTRTIASGAITIAGYSYYRVANEGGAATDDLETINGGTFDGQMLILAAASSVQDVVLKDGTGNLRLVSDFTLTHAQDRIQLMWDGAAWCEISRADNTL